MPISDMSAIQRQAFEDAIKLCYSAKPADGIRSLHKLAGSVALPADKVGIGYHEVLWLVELRRLPEARQRFFEIQSQLLSIDRVVDLDDRQLVTTLTVMLSFVEAKLLIEEGDKVSSLKILDHLSTNALSAPSTPAFEKMRNEVQTLRGFLLVDAGRYRDALPILESASPPPNWEALVSHYRARCYYELSDCEKAKPLLMEALRLETSAKWQARSHYFLGRIYYANREYSDAKTQFEQSLKFGDPVFARESKAFEWLESANQAFAASPDKDASTPSVSPKHKIN
jgi:tetratricopeptide (TPR) repeat protein